MAGLIVRSGRYYAEFFNAERTPNSRRFSLGTHRKDVARRKLAKWERDYELGRLDPWRDDPNTYDLDTSKRLTVGEALRRFLAQKEKDGKTSSTLKTYREVGGLFERQVGRSTYLDRVTPRQVEAFVREQSLSKATQYKRYGQLRIFLRWCVRHGFLQKSPHEVVEQPDKPSKLPKAVREDDLERVEQAIQKDYEDKLARGEVTSGQLIWLIPLFRFAFYTGMRSSELGRLRWGDIDHARRLITIRQQKNKREQTIPLTRKAANVLSELQEGNLEDYVFRSPGFSARQRSISSFSNNLARRFARYRDKAGVAASLTVHGLRHGFCTRLAEAGKSAVVIKEAARHADISTSMHYVHMANEHLKAELDDVFGG